MDARTETVPDIINLTGSGMADILAGDSRANVIKGAVAATTRCTAAPAAALTTLYGGAATTASTAAWRDDTLDGGGGNDTLLRRQGRWTRFTAAPAAT